MVVKMGGRVGRILTPGIYNTRAEFNAMAIGHKGYLRIDKLAASSRFGYETGGFAAPPGIDSTRFPRKKIVVGCPAGRPGGIRVNASGVGWQED